jgi:protoheme IX farnesyltransferase
MKAIKEKYLPLIKSLQTALLLLTGMAGYLSAAQTLDWRIFASLATSLLLAISGSTVLNMWYDRDIDSIMQRTCNRPLSAGRISPVEALCFGIILSILGIGLAVAIAPLYGLVVFSGLFLDVVIYTIWLKRRTCWSIIWGGLSGGMPVLAGRVLATGQVDFLGMLLALAVLFWIPTHILTFSMRYHHDYQAAGIPTVSSRYGFSVTRLIIALASILAAVTMILAAAWIGMTTGLLEVLAILGTALLILALTTVLRPSERLNFSLFKFASLYMLGAMILLAVPAF